MDRDAAERKLFQGLMGARSRPTHEAETGALRRVAQHLSRNLDFYGIDPCRFDPGAFDWWRLGGFRTSTLTMLEGLIPREPGGDKPRAGPPMRYTYCFAVWPSETWGFQRQTFDLFRMLGGRVEVNFTGEEFEAFRSALNRDGLTLREIERVPFHEPETVL